MTAIDRLNLVGVVVTAVGSSFGMAGVFLQTNGYYAFKSLELFGNMVRVARAFLRHGTKAAREQIDATAAIAELKGEDRPKSLLGLYCVLIGFFLQLTGSLVLIWSIFISH
jgi:hypothetical protein